MVGITPLLSNQEAKAAKGLKVFVEVDGKGEVCVRSDGASAGCKYTDDSGTLEFVFGAGEIQVGEEFEACAGSICVTRDLRDN